MSRPTDHGARQAYTTMPCDTCPARNSEPNHNVALPPGTSTPFSIPREHNRRQKPSREWHGGTATVKAAPVVHSEYWLPTSGRHGRIQTSCAVREARCAADPYRSDLVRAEQCLPFPVVSSFFCIKDARQNCRASQVHYSPVSVSFWNVKLFCTTCPILSST